MHRLIRMQSLLLLAAIGLAAAPLTIATVSFAASSTPSEGGGEDNTEGILLSQNNQKKKSVVEILADLVFKRRRKGNSQGEFCSISPSIYSSVTWSDRPLFVWQGTVIRIEVHRRGSEPTLIWSHEVTQEEQSKQSVPYAGSALKPGQKYLYSVTYQTTDEERTVTRTEEIPFAVLGTENEKRRRIEAELAKLENLSQSMNMKELEEFALQRADIFAQEDLLSDAIREVFSMPNPSFASTIEMKNFRNKFCE